MQPKNTKHGAWKKIDNSISINKTLPKQIVRNIIRFGCRLNLRFSFVFDYF
jgi:hypothetical protein